MDDWDLFAPLPQEIRSLNKIVAVTDRGLTYEADPPHADLLMSSLALTQANSCGTPDIEPTDRDNLADKTDEPANTKLNNADESDPDAVISSYTLRWQWPNAMREASTTISAKLWAVTMSLIANRRRAKS